ncbi:MAG TPA: tRNA uridine-5-carboxymethylaminomethyl(34) synthesis GTPase MnmE [Gammaproteobacteria bacterium]|nr:tRNA uridine-5-carboxymethylaminomethyl(34) synthesis GTPase MnmE [Gammaproteobacteria bacterium]
MNKTDTIVAPATALGRSSVSVIRISGSHTCEIAEKLLGKLPDPRMAYYSTFKDSDGNIIDKGLALFFPNPHSFTGEDILELQGHGGYVVVDLLIQEILKLGARLAKPGEFSERAFLNNKLDLAQAEAIADLIDAGSKQAALAAMQSLEGVFSQKIADFLTQLINLRIYIEAAIDFPEEEVDFLTEGNVRNKLDNLISELENIQQQAKQGVLLSQGMIIVIAGKPNAGKSSLLNLLSGRDSAIVTSIPGTTRDILREHIQLDGLPVQIIDTAGLRESDDPIEQEGVKRAKEMIQKADRVLYIKDIMDTEDDIHDELLHHPRLTIVYNKIDLKKPDKNTLGISAKTGEGLDNLKKYLKNLMGFSDNTETSFSARRRHVDALNRAHESLLHGKAQIEKNKAGELLAEDLRHAQKYLGAITGEFTSDDLLGKIFSSFCIGK